jgi:hypothetical protein
VRGFTTTYRLVLEAAEGDDAVPPATRLRQALKTAWRRDRLKCVRAEQLAVAGDWGPVDGSLPLTDGAGI